MSAAPASPTYSVPAMSKKLARKTATAQASAVGPASRSTRSRNEEAPAGTGCGAKGGVDFIGASKGEKDS